MFKPSETKVVEVTHRHGGREGQGMEGVSPSYISTWFCHHSHSQSRGFTCNHNHNWHQNQIATATLTVVIAIWDFIRS